MSVVMDVVGPGVLGGRSLKRNIIFREEGRLKVFGSIVITVSKLRSKVTRSK